MAAAATKTAQVLFRMSGAADHAEVGQVQLHLIWILQANLCAVLLKKPTQSPQH